MIIGLVGKPGSGKSLRLAELAIGSLMKGEDVYTNFRLRWLNVLMYAWRQSGRAWSGWSAARALVGRWRVVRTYADMGEVAEGKLYFDEAHIWLWSRAWQELPRDVISWWSQSRKHGVDVWWAAQRMNSIDAHVRELTAEVWHCRRVFNTNSFIYQCEDMESSDRGRRIWGRKLVRLNPVLANCYDTREILEPPYEVTQEGKVQARKGRRPALPGVALRQTVGGNGEARAYRPRVAGRKVAGAPRGQGRAFSWREAKPSLDGGRTGH